MVRLREFVDGTGQYLEDPQNLGDFSGKSRTDGDYELTMAS